MSVAYRQHMKVFISHSGTDAAEALLLAENLRKMKFRDVWTYETHLPFGTPAWTRIEAAIRECNVFIFLVSAASVASPAVAREIGLAQALDRENDCVCPLIVPTMSKSVLHKRDRPRVHPVADFQTAAPLPDIDLMTPRWFGGDNAIADSVEALATLLTPRLLVVGPDKDIRSAEELTKLQFYQLYEGMFEELERDDGNDLAKWALESDGTQRSVRLRGDIPHPVFDARFKTDLRTDIFVLAIYDTAIAFAVIGSSKAKRLASANYLGVHRAWRKGRTAQVIIEDIRQYFSNRNDSIDGVVFEVEQVDHHMLSAALTKLDGGASLDSLSAAEIDQIKRFRRIAWYEMDYKARVFMSRGKPLHFTMPCLDGNERENRVAKEKPMWMMWIGANGVPLNRGCRKAWKRAVHFILLEVNGKGIAENYDDVSYLKYTKALKRTILKSTDKLKIMRGRFVSNAMRRSVFKATQNFEM